jgi:hypothetical protein
MIDQESGIKNEGSELGAGLEWRWVVEMGRSGSVGWGWNGIGSWNAFLDCVAGMKWEVGMRCWIGFIECVSRLGCWNGLGVAG